MSRRLAELAMLVAAFAGATLLAELLGAANLGRAMTAGQVAFAVVLVAILLVRRP